jgi:hypothetical protein
LSLAAVCLFLLLPALSAGAAQPTSGDHVTIDLGAHGGPLRARGVSISALKPATRAGRSLTLPVGDVSTPGVTTGQLILRGGVKLKRGTRSIKIEGLLVKVQDTHVTISARVGKKRMSVFSGRTGAGGVNAAFGTVAFTAKRMTLKRQAARAIARKLHTRRARSNRLGSARGDSSITVPPDKPRDPDDGLPLSDFNFPEQMVLDQPPGAVAVTAAHDLVFWPRDSWITYLAGGGGTSAEAPATPGPAINMAADHRCPFAGPAGDARPYSFNMPFVSGWWHAASKTGVLRYSGAVRFRYPAHGLNIRFADPIVEFRGDYESSRVLVRASDPWNAKLTDLETIPGVAGLPGVLTRFDGLLTAHGSGVLGGAYPVGSSFGCVEIGIDP